LGKRLTDEKGTEIWETKQGQCGAFNRQGKRSAGCGFCVGRKIDGIRFIAPA